MAAEEAVGSDDEASSGPRSSRRGRLKHSWWKSPGGSRFLVPLTGRVQRLGSRELGRAERERGRSEAPGEVYR